MPFAATRFLWRATRHHRLRPWRSPYLRWRIETYSGIPAESIGARAFLAFAWREQGALWRFLGWCSSMARYRRQSRRAVQSAQAGPAETT